METQRLYDAIAALVAATHMPFLTVKRYAEITGETQSAVRLQVEEGFLPIKPRRAAKGRIYINLEKLREEARNASY